MTDATDPQTQQAPPEVDGDPTAGVRTGGAQPSPAELNSQLRDGSGNAVGAQPTDDNPADLADARARSEWDQDTAGGEQH